MHYVFKIVSKSIQGHLCSISNLHLLTIDIILICVTTYDKEIQRTCKHLYKYIINKIQQKHSLSVIIPISETVYMALDGIQNYL